MSVAATLSHTSPVRRGRAALIGLWVLQVALAGMFFMAGGSKLAGAPQMVALFKTIGLGQWFRYVTGAIEVGSAIALLVPRAAVYGALLLVPTMVGAVLTELFIAHDPFLPPLMLGIAAAIVLWARRRELPVGVRS